jgi:hypothetical protein
MNECRLVGQVANLPGQDGILPHDLVADPWV